MKSFRSFLIILMGVGLATASCAEPKTRIAWVGPATTPEGRGAVQAIRLYLANARAPVTLDVYDDRNDPEQARQLAEQIVATDAVAVIGHHCLDCSRAGQAVYARHQMPAVTAINTDEALTRESDWYFRVIGADTFAARYLAHYVAELSDTSSVTVLAPEGTSAPAQVFEQTWAQLRSGPVITHAKVSEITESTPLLIVQSPAESARAIRTLRQRGFEEPIIGTLDMLSAEFLDSFKDVRVANGVYVAAPFTFDAADERAGRFRRDYFERHGELPGFIEAFSADAAAVLVEGLKRAGPYRPLEMRSVLRDQLASMSSPATAVPGITGPTWFDEKGDPAKPISMARLMNGAPEVAMLQLGASFQPVDVVLAGVRVEEFFDIDLDEGTFGADVYVWFRHRGIVDLSQLLVTNEAAEVLFNDPVAEQRRPGLEYRAYRFKAKLRSDYFAGRYGEHILGISFRHRSLTRDRLIFARDSAGMGVQTARNQAERLRQIERLVDPDDGWRVKRVVFFEDTMVEHSIGNPIYLERLKKTVDYSRYNIGVAIGPKSVTLRRSIAEKDALGWTLLAALVSFVLLFAGKSFKRVRFVLQVASTLLLLVAAEVYVGELLLERTGRLYLGLGERIFDLFWWLAPALLLTAAIKRFVWEPIEQRSERAVPTILRLFVSFMVYTLAIFGIVAFVFDQKLTSLLATSGVFAMIIGLAIQINITNIFSGIALNLERPFRVGDWILVHGRTAHPSDGVIGQVIDINWRTTRLKTTSRTMVVIPNGRISERTITNFMRPSEVSRFELLFLVDQEVPSDRVINIIKTGVAAVVGAENNGPLAEPKFKVRIDLPTPDGLQYSVRYFIIPREVSPAKARHSVTESVVKHLSEAGISLAHHQRDVSMRRVEGPIEEDLGLSD